MCARRLQARANFLVQSSHEWGLSPKNKEFNIITKSNSINDIYNTNKYK